MPTPPFTVQQLHDASVQTGVKSKKIIEVVAEIATLDIAVTAADAELVTVKAESATAVADEETIRVWLNANGPVDLRGSL